MGGIQRSFLVFFIVILAGCEPQLVDDPIPLITFQDQVINLGLPEFNALRNEGGVMTYKYGGIRGLIIYRVNANTYNAYDRNCSYHPNEASATVEIHSSSLYLVDYSCKSQFSKETGQPQGGPAWRPLRQYHTDVTGSILTITSDAIN